MLYPMSVWVCSRLYFLLIVRVNCILHNFWRTRVFFCGGGFIVVQTYLASYWLYHPAMPTLLMLSILYPEDYINKKNNYFIMGIFLVPDLVPMLNRLFFFYISQEPQDLWKVCKGNCSMAMLVFLVSKYLELSRKQPSCHYIHYLLS